MFTSRLNFKFICLCTRRKTKNIVYPKAYQYYKLLNILKFLVINKEKILIKSLFDNCCSEFTLYSIYNGSEKIQF